MTSKERLLGAINRTPVDHVPMMEVYWETTIERWKKEGLPATLAGSDLMAYFQQDECNTTYVDWSFQYPTGVIEETDEYVISRSADNVKSKSLKASPSMLGLSDYSVTDRASWEENKPRLAFNEKRVDIEKAKRLYRETGDAQLQIYMEPCLGVEKFKYCSGTENLLYMIAAEQELVLDMVEATERLAFDGLDYCLGQRLEFDVGFITEDMGFSNGPFFSPRFYQEVIMPSHKRWCDYLHSKKMKAMLHTCGDNRKLLKYYVEAGFDILNPLEQKAGMDLIQVKKDFGKALTLWGGIDVMTITSGDMRKLHDEIRDKVLFAKQGGGYIFGSDHSIPDNVPFPTYHDMLKWGLEYGKY